MKQIRIICTIICALCLAAVMPIGTFFGLEAAILCGVGAGLFFLLMLLCKQSQEFKEEKERASQPAPSQEENEQLSPAQTDTKEDEDNQ